MSESNKSNKYVVYIIIIVILLFIIIFILSKKIKKKSYNIEYNNNIVNDSYNLELGISSFDNTSHYLEPKLLNSEIYEEIHNYEEI